MTPTQLAVYIEEIAIHATVAQRELAELLALCDDPNRRQERGVWIHLQAFLVHAGMVSKFFFPSSKDPLSRSRGAALRQELEISRDSELALRSARNAFEHMDERMDNWLRSPRHRILECVLDTPDSLDHLSAERWAVRRVLILEPFQLVSEERNGRAFMPLKPLTDGLQALLERCDVWLTRADPYTRI